MRAVVLAAAVAASTPAIAVAQAFDPKRGFNPPISDAMVAALSAAVLDNMHRLRCGEAACAAATEAEKANGLILPAEARETIRKGMLSQVGECAGVDWRRASFEPMMREWRHGRKASERQLAFVGALHGAAMAVTLRSIGGACPKREGSDRGR